jgi:hypothetical protein
MHPAPIAKDAGNHQVGENRTRCTGIYADKNITGCFGQ